MVATVLLSMIIVSILSTLIGAYRVSAKARAADHARYVIKSLSDQFLTQATADTGGNVYPMFQLTLNPSTGNQQPMGTGIAWTNSDGSLGQLSSDQTYFTVMIDGTTTPPTTGNVTRSVWYLYDTDGSETLLNQNKSGGYLIEGTFTISYKIFNVQVPPISLTNIRAFP
jgi:type II secretory pathway pseudopilin PulG